jgi:hypothetical protein
MKTSTSIRLAAALLAAAAAYILGLWFFFGMPFTPDENSYVFQANYNEKKICDKGSPAGRCRSYEIRRIVWPPSEKHQTSSRP